MRKKSFTTIIRQMLFVGISLMLPVNWAVAQEMLSADDYFRRGIEKVSADNCPDAVKDFDEAIRLNGNEAKFYKERGDCRLKRLGELEKALADFNQAIKLKPDYAEAYLSRAMLYFFFPPKSDQATDFDHLAIADFDKAIKLNPKHYQSFVIRAFFLLGKEKPLIKEGLADLAKAIEINPNGEEAYLLRMSFYKRNGDFDKALVDATAMTKNSKSGLGFIERAKIYAETGKYQEAVADFTEALKRDPLNPAVLQGRAAAYRAVGKISLAEADEKTVKNLKQK
jgi:tetratricopeptide (TPR) repeat protein